MGQADSLTFQNIAPFTKSSHSKSSRPIHYHTQKSSTLCRSRRGAAAVTPLCAALGRANLPVCPNLNRMTSKNDGRTEAKLLKPFTYSTPLTINRCDWTPSKAASLPQRDCHRFKRTNVVQKSRKPCAVQHINRTRPISTYSTFRAQSQLRWFPCRQSFALERQPGPA